MYISLLKNFTFCLFTRIVLKTDREVRLKVLHLLLTLSNVEHRNQLIVLVIQELISYDEELMKNNNRYFNDSLIHRKKNKLLQALLILENFIHQNSSCQLEVSSSLIFVKLWFVFISIL